MGGKYFEYFEYFEYRDTIFEEILFHCELNILWWKYLSKTFCNQFWSLWIAFAAWEGENVAAKSSWVDLNTHWVLPKCKRYFAGKNISQVISLVQKYFFLTSPFWAVDDILYCSGFNDTYQNPWEVEDEEHYDLQSLYYIRALYTGYII